LVYDLLKVMVEEKLVERWIAPTWGYLQGSSVLVALSGGRDSIALADLLLLAEKRLQLQALEFVHIDHALRPQSAEEALCVARWMELRGKKVQITRLNGEEANSSGEGVEGWARRERYRALEVWRERLKCDWIVTAHHRNDQAETVLLRLARGCGLSGLVGIKKVDRQRHLLRPLLDRSSAEIELWCQKRGLSWLEDESNRDLRFRRNEIRHQLLPLLESREAGYSFRLAFIAEESARLHPYLKRWAEESYPSIPGEEELWSVEVNAEDVAIDGGALLRLAVDEYCEGCGCPSIDSRRWERLVLAVMGRRKQVEMLSPTCSIEVVKRGAGWRLQLRRGECDG